MILLEKRVHLVLKTPLAVVRLLFVDVIDQRADVGGADREQPVPALPREVRSCLLLHPNGRTGLDLRDNLRRRSRRSQPHGEMHMVGNSTNPKAFTIQLSGRTGKISVQNGTDLVVDQRCTLFRREHDMHQVETQRLWHPGNYMSDLQPSPVSANTYLGLRPRLLCSRTFGPSGYTPRQTGHRSANRPHLSAHLNQAPKARQHTSLGRRPRSEAQRDRRAESPTHRSTSSASQGAITSQSSLRARL
jgi:hypothetical protein